MQIRGRNRKYLVRHKGGVNAVSNIDLGKLVIKGKMQFYCTSCTRMVIDARG
jgi:hypothetical protein